MTAIDSEVPPHNYPSPQTDPLPPPFTTPQQRIFSLDVLRGVAILGGLFVSVWLFGGLTVNQQTGLLTRSKGFDYRLYGTVNLLLFGKMISMIALVFGAGMIISLSRESKVGRPTVADIFMRRQFWLILIGIINGVLLLWSGDLLFHLGVMGVLLFPFSRLNKKGLFVASMGMLLIATGKIYWNYADDRRAYRKYAAVVSAEEKMKKDSALISRGSINSPVAKDTAAGGVALAKNKMDTLTKEQVEDKSAWEGKVKGLKYDPKKDDENRKTMRSASYATIWNYTVRNTQFKEASWTYTTGIWQLGMMILLGMALLKAGFFNDSFPPGRRMLIGVGGLGIGLLLGWFRLDHQQDTLADYGKYIAQHWLPPQFFFPLEMAVMSVGWSAIILSLLKVKVLGRTWRAFAYSGRMALSHYLCQCIVCGLFFTGAGMGYFGRLTQYQLYLFALDLAIVQLAFSFFWLRYFLLGPMEWLLRCIVYRKWLPNRRVTTDLKMFTGPLA